MNNLEILPFASELAREAGALLLQHRDRGVGIEYKGGYDLVTAADRAAEKLIVEKLRSRFPSHTIIAEEGSGVERDSDYVWYVDPLDGTTNFAHNFPVFAVSIGLELEGQGVAGVVYDPSRDELFAAERGSGAYLNSRRIKVSKTAELSKGLFATGFPNSDRNLNPNVLFFQEISMRTHGVRRPGAAALDLCSVACGRIDGFWEIGLKPWDVSAGAVIAGEAGGRVSSMTGGPHRSGDAHIAVTNGLLHEELTRLLRDVSEGRVQTPIPALAPL